jgi:hypothetical protein
MARAPKPRAKRKPKKPKLSDKAQSERFIEAARKLGIEKTDGAFEAALRKIIGWPPGPMPNRVGRRSR